MKKHNKIILLGLVILGLFLVLRGWDDEKLFTTIVRTGAKPNVAFLVDYTGSMCMAIYHPDFDPNLLLPKVNISNAKFSDGSYDYINRNVYNSRWYMRWVRLDYPSAGYKKIYASNDHTHILSINGSEKKIDTDGNGNYIRVGDWIIKSDGTAKVLVTDKTKINNNRYQFVFDDTTQDGTFAVNDALLVCTNSEVTGSNPRQTRIVFLYGTDGSWAMQAEVWYDTNNDSSFPYLRWMFAEADDSQRDQISALSKLAAHVDDCYSNKRAPASTEVTNAVTEWNGLWPQLFPSQIADLGNTVNDTTTAISYTNPKDSFASYFGDFFIKIDAETMYVPAGGNDTTNRVLTVQRASRNTLARSHASGTKILIFKTEEYTPITNLFSSLQHQNDETGVPDATWTDASGYYRYKRAFTRIQVEREALGDVAIKSREKVWFGLFYFNSDNQYSTMLQGITDFTVYNPDGTVKATYNSLNPYLDKIWSLNNPNNGTPLALAVSGIWQYYKPGTSTSPNYRSGENWNVVKQNYGFETDALGNIIPKGSPIRYWCQKNYLVLLTDGQANGDSGLTNNGVFANRIKRTSSPVPGEYWRWTYTTDPTKGWGDLDDNDYTSTNPPSTRTYCPGETCWQFSSSGRDFTDDLAYFMYHQDMFPTRDVNGNLAYYDEVNDNPAYVWKGDQNISTYAIGLTVRNDMLAETAANGHGLFFSVSNYSDLAESFVAVIENILLREDPMMYTTYAAPKQSITEGRFGYVANFVPKNGNSVWEGHLKRYRLADDGNFPENIDLLNKDNRGEVMVNGSPVPSFLWDIYDTFKDRTVASRTIFTYKGTTKTVFTAAAIAKEDLNVASDALRDTVVSFIRGNYGTGYTWKAGDTFHFNPLVVGYPLKWKAQFDASYLAFYKYYAIDHPRIEVIYVGANDGMVHCYRASDGYELWGFIPPSQLTKLQYPALNSASSAGRRYFVDGKAIVTEIKVASYGDERDWKTVMIFGMGIGGKTYCALDVTNPADPKMMWEFTDQRMGYTESRPVVADINTGSGRIPAVILSGGYNMQEVAADSTDSSIPAAIKLEGKSLYVLNANSGQLIKKFIYDTSESDSLVDGVYVHTNPAFKYAFAAPTAALDQNSDGVADYLYAMESGDYRIANDQGGRIWKINIYGNPALWQPQCVYQAEAGQTFFIGMTLGYDSSYKLWVMAGTGRRSKPTSTDSSDEYNNLTGQFLCFLDDSISAGIYSTTPLTNGLNLTNITTYVRNEETVSVDLTGAVRGFYTNFVKAQHEILFDPPPIYVASRVYFMTFAPEGSSGGSGGVSDPCSGSSDDSGQHFVYNFGISSTGSAVSITSPQATNQKILGFGPLSSNKYKIYIGQGSVGGFIVTANNPITLDDIFGPIYWKEDKR